MTDTLSLGGVVFNGYSPPETMMGGGNQAMVVHKLPGGGRVIDTLGPDEAQITWAGTFFANDAYQMAMRLDAMRASGQILPLIWGGRTRMVVIESFIFKVHRYPLWVEYSITCTVYQNPILGILGSTGSSQVTSLVSNDLSATQSVATDNLVSQQAALIGQGGTP